MKHVDGRSRAALVKARFRRYGKNDATRAGILQVRRVICRLQRKTLGGFMTTPTIQCAGNPNSARAEGVRDLLMISSFGFWAVLLGLMPVLALHGMIGR
ncbi:MAG TPA: hypothetical protein VII39_06970 [Bradyrhizobium sp.]